MSYLFKAVITTSILVAASALGASHHETLVEKLKPSLLLPLKPIAIQVLSDLGKTLKEEVSILGVLPKIEKDIQKVEYKEDYWLSNIWKSTQKEKKALKRVRPHMTADEYHKAYTEIEQGYAFKRAGVLALSRPKLQVLEKEKNENRLTQDELHTIRHNEKKRKTRMKILRQQHYRTK